MSEPSVHEYFSLSERSLPLTVTTYSVAPHERLFPAHWHQQIEILAVTEGSMRVVCADTLQVVTAGEVLFVNPYESHLGYAGEDGVVYRCLIMEPSLWYDTLQDGSVASLPPISNHLIDKTILSLIEIIVNEFHSNEIGRELSIRAHLLLIFSHALRRHRAAVTHPTEPDALIGEIMRYIHQHYADKLSTHQLADVFGFSLSYFCRYFKTATGTTVLEYINAVRLSRSCRLLQQTDLPISTIARQVGFTGVNYFVRQFHEHMDCSPLQFRKQNRT